MKKWKVLSTNKKIASEDDIIEELFRIRKISDKDIFLNPSKELLSIKNTGILEREVKKSCKRINRAIKENEKIIILGDYDVDGICASAILWETIYSKYKNVFPYIPDRFSEGYGISKNTIDNLLKKYPDTKLIITVDNGIVANAPIEYAKDHGIDVIVTDHHLAGKKLPEAYSIVHTTNLCGAGVAWILAKELGFAKKEEINEKLELAALATVTDLVPLADLNRVLLKLGLEKLRTSKRLGILELLRVCGIAKENVGVYEIGHMIGPRLNAAGRVDHAIESLRLICSNDKKFVTKIVLLLENTNRVRQQMVTDSLEHAKMSLSLKNIKKVVIVHDKSYSEGVIGLISSKLVDHFYKPAVTISLREKISKGSARSVSRVNIVELLRSVSGILTEVGGHPMAAGFSIETKNIEKFYELLEKEAEKITDEKLERELKIDMEIPIGVVKESLYKKLQQFSPFGMGNPEPVFLVKNIEILDYKKIGKDGSHLKIVFNEGRGRIEAIGFGMGEVELEGNKNADIVFTIDLNSWRDKKTLQLKLKDIKFVKT